MEVFLSLIRIRGCIPTECPEYVILNFYRAIHSYGMMLHLQSVNSYGMILHLHRNPLGLHRSVEKIQI
ncbi:MAG: hypothetical protein LBN95_12260 [Prevotellaceae bacterium]|nr:hypothetical protein [Prevotellaceae bacterium]